MSTSILDPAKYYSAHHFAAVVQRNENSQIPDRCQRWAEQAMGRWDAAFYYCSAIWVYGDVPGKTSSAKSVCRDI